MKGRPVGYKDLNTGSTPNTPPRAAVLQLANKGCVTRTQAVMACSTGDSGF